MNTIEAFIWIGEMKQFRRVILQYDPPRFGNAPAYSVNKVTDKRTGTECNLEQALKSNNLPQTVAEEVAKKQGLEREQLPLTEDGLQDLPF